MRVIIISYYFPPLGLAGTARPLALANFFAARGDEVIVVTVKPIAYPAYDKSMETEIDKRVSVIRVGSIDPARLSRFLPLRLIKKMLGRSAQQSAAATLFPDSKVGFAAPAARAVKSLVDEGVSNLVITTSPPVSAHLVGIEAASQDNVRWIADWRDVWSSLPFADSDDAKMQRAKALQEQIVNAAMLVTATSPKTAETFARKYDAAAKTMFVPNGFSEDDFREPVEMLPQTIGLYGTLNHLVGFEQIAEWLGEYSRHASGDFRVCHTGYLDVPDIEKIMKSNSLEQKFSSSGYLPHRESVAAMRRSAVNVIGLSSEVDTSFVVPSKLWEMLRAEPPLIAVLPKGNAARTILEERKFPGVIVADAAEQFAGALAEFLGNSEESRGLRNAEMMREFQWKEQFNRLAQRIDEMMK